MTTQVTRQAAGHSIRLDLRVVPLTATCECGTTYTDPDPLHFARWVARHVGVLAPQKVYGCGHAICCDDDGHTDGCLLDGSDET
jgi:hypothetical protein